MAHDEGRLGVVLGLLVEGLHGWHLFSFLWHLEAVGDEDDVVLAGNGRKKLKGEPGPEFGEPIELQSGGVKKMEETVVLFRSEKTGADEAGDAEKFGPDRKADQGEAHPHKSSVP
jgi:hypothetical protein